MWSQQSIIYQLYIPIKWMLINVIVSLTFTANCCQQFSDYRLEMVGDYLCEPGE